MNGTRVVVLWVAWTALLSPLWLFDGAVGIALPIPTALVIGLSSPVGLVLLLLLIYSPPIAVTVAWWRRSRRSGSTPC